MSISKKGILSMAIAGCLSSFGALNAFAEIHLNIPSENSVHGEVGHTLYDTKIIACLPPADDAGAMIYSIGTIQDNQRSLGPIPSFSGVKVVIGGSSTPDGTMDVFAGPSTGFLGNDANPNSYCIPFVGKDGKPVYDELSFYKKKSDGAYEVVGKLTRNKR